MPPPARYFYLVKGETCVRFKVLEFSAEARVTENHGPVIELKTYELKAARAEYRRLRKLGYKLRANS